MKLITNWLMRLEPPQNLKPKELFELGYMWVSDDALQIVTGPENYELD